MLRRVPSKSKITSFVISSAKVANSMTKLAITLLILVLRGDYNVRRFFYICKRNP